MTKYITNTKNHVSIAKEYLLEQYKNRKNIEGFLTSIISPLQDIENTLYSIYKNSSLFIASGCYLDRIGAIIGEDRNFRKDDEYKLALFIRIIGNNGGGTPEELLVILRNIYKVNYLEYFESGEAYFQIYIESNNSLNGINNILDKLKPAGVSPPSIIYSKSNNVFRFSESSKTSSAFIVKNLQSQSTMQTQKNELDKEDMQITFDSFDIPKNTYGYAEIIVHKFDIKLNDNELYLINKENSLETIMSYKDFSINGGSCFAEVIRKE